MSQGEAEATTKSVRRRRPWLWGLLIMGLGLLVLVIWLGRPREFRPPRLPDPNGYEDFLRAADEVVGDVPSRGRPTAADRDALRAFVDKNAKALRDAERGLTRESAVILPAAYPIDQAWMGQVGKLRHLGRLLRAQAQLAELDNRTDDATTAYARVIRFGAAVGRGGFLINHLAGIAVQTPGLQGLSGLVDRLSREECHQLLMELGPIDRDRESALQVFDREHAWHMAKGGLGLRVAYRLNARTFRKLEQPAEKAGLDADRASRDQLRRLLIRLALRAYQVDHERMPDRLAALVPEYLPAVPLDPYSGRPYVYQAQGTDSYELSRPEPKAPAGRGGVAADPASR